MYVETNTRILVPEFEFTRPSSLRDALLRLGDKECRSRPMLGGTDLLVQMKMERKSPACLVDLNGIAELRGIMASETDLRIGAGTTIRELSRANFVRERFQSLTEACRAFSTVPIMVMGTVGGNICNASPAADTVPALLIFDAAVEIASLAEHRSIPLREFLVAPGETALRKGEILISVRIATPPKGTGSAFIKLARVTADISKVCVAVKLVRERNTIVDCRIALGAVGPTAIRLERAETYLIGIKYDERAVDAAAKIASQDITPITDVRATREYRRAVSQVITRDALTMAWKRAGERSVP